MKYPTEPRWFLETLPRRSGWTEMIAMAFYGKERRHFTLSHNGQRFAKGNGFVDLSAEYPDVLVQIAGWLESPH
jgi:hypothetical protein